MLVMINYQLICFIKNYITMKLHFQFLGLEISNYNQSYKHSTLINGKLTINSDTVVLQNDEI